MVIFYTFDTKNLLFSVRNLLPKNESKAKWFLTWSSLSALPMSLFLICINIHKKIWINFLIKTKIIRFVQFVFGNNNNLFFRTHNPDWKVSACCKNCCKVLLLFITIGKQVNSNDRWKAKYFLCQEYITVPISPSAQFCFRISWRLLEKETSSKKKDTFKTLLSFLEI